MFNKANKFKNTRSKGIDGHHYASKLEASVANMLFNMERAGVLKIIARQVKFNFFADSNNVVFCSGKPKVKNCTKILGYIPDFEVQDTATGEIYYVEAKGDANSQDWKRKCALWFIAAEHKLAVYSGRYSYPVLQNTIFPKFYQKDA